MKFFFTNKSLAFLVGNITRKVLNSKISLHVYYKKPPHSVHLIIPKASRYHPEPKIEHFFYTHNHFTTMTKLLAIDVVKNIIHDK